MIERGWQPVGIGSEVLSHGWNERLKINARLWAFCIWWSFRPTQIAVSHYDDTLKRLQDFLRRSFDLIWTISYASRSCI